MKAFVFAFALMICARLSAQTTINGNLTEHSTKQAIEFATVTLIHIPDSSVRATTVTDKKGKFEFRNVEQGSYMLRLTFIGYEKNETSEFKIGPGTPKYTVAPIELFSASKNMADVTVVGRRTTLNTSIDRKIYNVDQDIMSRSGSASDILKNIPSVEVDIEGNVALRGSGDVMILINGKPSPLMGRTRAEVLQQLPANSIERIEVITNPSARYRPDGTSGIINIVLKKNIKNGFNGTATGNAGNRSRYNGSLTLNYHPKKFNLFGSYSQRQDSRKRYNTIERTTINTGTALPEYFNQYQRSSAYPHPYIATAGFDYTINEQNSFGISGSYFSRKQIRRDSSNTVRQNSLHELISNSDRLRYDPEIEKHKNITGYYEHGFGKEDHSIRIEFSTSKEDEVEDNHYTNLYRYPAKVTGYENIRIAQGTNEKQLTIDYTNPLTEDSKLEAGYDGLFNRVDLNFYGENFDTAQHQFLKDITRSNQFIYHESVHAIYETYQKSYEHFGFSAGLRVESVITEGHLVTKDSFVTNNYFKIYPTVHFSYKIKENKEIQLNYSKRVHRPEADELNPFPEYQDSLNLRAGNPKLLPEIIHSIELGYKWQNKNFSFVPSLYYRYKKDGFTSVIVRVNDSVLLSTTQNLSNDQSAGLELIFSAKAGTWLSTNLSTNVFYNRINASDLGFIQNKSIVSMSANWTANISFSKSTMMQLSSNYRSARLTPQGKNFASFVMNAGVRQDLFKAKLSATLTASDIFNTLKQRSEYTISSLQQTTIGRRDGRIIYFGLSYRFGVVKKAKEEKLQFDNSL